MFQLDLSSEHLGCSLETEDDANACVRTRVRSEGSVCARAPIEPFFPCDRESNVKRHCLRVSSHWSAIVGLSIDVKCLTAWYTTDSKCTCYLVLNEEKFDLLQKKNEITMAFLFRKKYNPKVSCLFRIRVNCIPTSFHIFVKPKSSIGKMVNLIITCAYL